MAASPQGTIDLQRDVCDLEDLLETWQHLSPTERLLNALRARYYMHRSRIWIVVFVLTALLGFVSYQMGIEPGIAITLVLLGSALTLIVIFEIERRNRK